MKKKVLVAKILGFTAVAVWIMGFLAAAITLGPYFLDLIGVGESVAATAMLGWYLITVLLISIWVAVKGFNFVGKWEKK